MKISIIMPIYNAEKRIRRSLDSILDQTYREFELILINDGSTDNSLSICEAYEKKDEKIKLISIENSGPGFARNVGIKKARGAYLCFVDADDFLHVDFLERLMKIIGKDDFDIVTSNFYRVDGDMKESKNNYKTGKIDRYGSREERKRYNLFKSSSSFGYVWGKIYKLSFIRKNHIKFNEEKQVFLEDTLFNLKAISYNPRYYILNEPLYYYHVYEDSLSNKKEDITSRAINMLENYESFLKNEKKYRENIDLFVPLATRTISWSLFKSMEVDYNFKNTYEKVLCFSRNETIREVLTNEKSVKQLLKIHSRLQVLLYRFIMLAIRYELEKLLALFFYINYPLFNIYIKKAVKT